MGRLTHSENMAVKYRLLSNLTFVLPMEKLLCQQLATYLLTCIPMSVVAAAEDV